MNGKQLKNSILQWAIQGKLVPQNPKDEPASKLLERIATQRIIASGAKQSKKTPASRIYREGSSWFEQVGSADPKDITEEIPFDIPESWEWARLFNLSELIEDCPHSTAPNEGAGYPLIRTPNVGFGRLIFDGVHRVSEKTYHKRNERAVPKANDLIFAREAPAGNIAVIQEGEIVCLGQRTVLVRPVQAALDSDYLAYYILSPSSQQNLVGKSTGTTVAHVNLADFRPYFVALPPLAEQKRIVKKLEQILPLVDEYDQAQTQLDKLNKELPESLKKSILQQAIQGKLVPQNPKDEPADKLLERITISRHSEHSEESSKKSRKSSSKNPVSRIYRDSDGLWYEQTGSSEPVNITEEIPFEIPETWAWCRFSELVDFRMGKTPPRADSSMWSNGVYNWVSISDMKDMQVISETKEKLSQKAFENAFGSVISPAGTMIMSFKLTIGRVSFLGVDSLHNEAIISIFPYYDENNIFRDFLARILGEMTQYVDAAGAIKGNTLNKDKINNMLIPLPPLAEQKRIVAKLEQIFKVL